MYSPAGDKGCDWRIEGEMNSSGDDANPVAKSLENVILTQYVGVVAESGRVA